MDKEVMLGAAAFTVSHERMQVMLIVSVSEKITFSYPSRLSTSLCR